ncbi:LysR substrate-binding domain-containing protein [Sphingopyxis terrae subsp. ummariensis]
MILTVRPAAALTEKWGTAAHAFLFVSLCETKEHCAEGRVRPWTLKQVQGDEGGRNADVCQLSDFYVMPHLQSGALVSLLDPLRPQEEPTWAVYPQRRHLLPKVRLLIDKLREELPGALWRSERD